PISAERAPETPAQERARERAAARAPATHRRVARPPGALPEADFLAVCETCHRCVDACPEDAIVPAMDMERAGRVGTPMLPLQRVACALCADVPCAVACPTGALRPIPVTQIRLGRAEVMRNLCLNHLGQPCEICVDHCPIGDAALSVGADGFPVVGADACTGCGQCVVRCPTYPAAIRVVPR
ncbi:MAG: 4Fe-4S dicluster domain-containing protein, partial [Myxococcales bacterium]|nr:4Fe-4S dicluster domain-containing protein [Myxococcales bacterium]